MCVQVDSCLVGSSSAGVVIGAGGSASLRGNRIELNELDGVLVRGPAYGDDAGELAVFQDNFVAGNGQAALARTNAPSTATRSHRFTSSPTARRDRTASGGPSL